MLESLRKIVGEVGKQELTNPGNKADPDKRLDVRNKSDELKPQRNFQDLDKRVEVENRGNGVQNKLDGCKREEAVYKELANAYPEKEKFQIKSEVYLRDKDGNIVKDSKTGEARRIDFAVFKDNKVVDMVEVTSKTAPKLEQISKEYRIRDAGGNYIKDDSGKLIKVPNNVETRIDRRN